jgi:hypothetical protein
LPLRKDRMIGREGNPVILGQPCCRGDRGLFGAGSDDDASEESMSLEYIVRTRLNMALRRGADVMESGRSLAGTVKASDNVIITSGLQETDGRAVLAR